MVTAVCAEKSLATTNPKFLRFLHFGAKESPAASRETFADFGMSAGDSTTGNRCEVSAFWYRLWARSPRSARFRAEVFGEAV